MVREKKAQWEKNQTKHLIHTWQRIYLAEVFIFQ